MDDNKKADKLYNRVLKDKIYPLIGNKTTYLTELNDVGQKLFKNKYYGTFPSDKIPKLTDKMPYCILNLDSSEKAGSHWVALAKHKKVCYLYDSFGRKSTMIIPNLAFSGNGRILNTDDDVEQKVKEVNCGARCLAFLYVFDKNGSDVAKLI
jgi:hypothetical protein